MELTKKILPLIDDFKAEAHALTTNDNSLGYSQALNKLAVQYGYKNYNAIKPALKTEFYPVSFSYVEKHVSKHLECYFLSGGGNADYFVSQSYEYLDCIFSGLKFLYKGDMDNPTLTTKEDLLAFLDFFDFTVLIPFTAYLLKFDFNSGEKLEKKVISVIGKSAYDEMMSFVSSDLKEVSLDDYSIQDLQSYFRIEIGILNPHDVGYLSGKYDIEAIMQLDYLRQSVYPMFVFMSKNWLTKEYYTDFKLGIENNTESDEVVQTHIDTYNILSNAISMHGSKEAFIEDILRNSPVDKRIKDSEFMEEDILGILYDKWGELRLSFERIRTEKSDASVLLLRELISDFQDELFEKEMREVREELESAK